MGDHFRPGSTGITCPLCPKSKRCRLCQTWECFHHNPASAASSGAIRDREYLPCQGRTAPTLIRSGVQPALGTALPSSLYGGERICTNNSPDWRLVPGTVALNDSTPMATGKIIADVCGVCGTRDVTVPKILSAWRKLIPDLEAATTN
jgi:hypothetical protein